MNKDNHNDFENQGWEAMLQSLNREMPVEKKRRRFLWLAFFIGLTAIMGGGFWYINTESPVTTVDKTISKPIVDIDLSKNDLSKNTVAEPNPDNIGKEDKNVDFNNNNTIIENKIANKNNNSLSSINKNKSIDNHNNKNLNLVGNNKPIDNNNNNLYSLENNKLIDNNNNNLSLVENNKSIDKRNEMKSIELLNKIKIAPLSIEQDSNLKIEPQTIYGPIKYLADVPKKLRIGITTGLHTEKGQKIDGFQAGFVVNQTLNHRWSINTGLNFRQTHTSGDSISYYKTEYLANASPTTNLQSGTPISLDKLYYLELPLTIEYLFKKKFAFSTGLKTSYLIGQSVKENGGSVYFVKSSFTSQSSYDLLNKVNATTLGLNRWDVSLMGGFSYLPTKHVQLGLRYDFGLNNIINRTNWSAYNRYLGFNVVYLF